MYVAGKGVDGGVREILAPGRVAAVYRASGALAAAGAYDPLAWYEIPLGAERISLAWKYTDDGSASSPFASIRPQFKSSEIADEVFRDVEIESAASSGSTIKRSAYGLEMPLRGASATAYAVVFRVMPGMTHFAAPAAETGDTAHPGTLALWITAGS